MLQTMRSSSKSVVAVIMFVILIVSFGLWGVGDIFRDSARDPVAAEVADIKIHAREVREGFNLQLQALQQSGRPIGFEQAVQLGLPNIVLEGLIGEALRTKLVQDKGLTVSDDRLRALIVAEPAFRNQLGQFDRQIYQYFLQRERMNEAMHLAQLRRDFGANQFYGALEQDIRVPDAYRDLVYRIRFERRVAQTALLPLSAIKETPTPSDEALQTYYEANKTRFAQPEYRKLDYVYVKADDVLNEIKVSDQKIREEYEIRRNEFTKPETRELEQVIVDSEEKARKVADLVAKGATLADAAKEALGDAGRVISLGEVGKGELPAEIADPAFELAEGAVSAPIRTGFGWHIVRAVKVTPQTVKTLDEVRDQIVEAVRRTQAPDLLLSRATDLERQINRGTPLEEAARSIGAKVQTVEAIDAQGGGRDGLPATDIDNVRELTRRAFNLRKGDESGLTELGNGDFFVFRVVDVFPARVPELSEIKDKVVSAWQQTETLRLAEEKAKALVEKANAGGDFAALLKAEGLEPTATPPFTRNVNDPANNMPRALATKIFALEPGKAAVEPVEGGIAIARLTEVTAADPAADANGLTATRQQIAGSMRDTVRFAVDGALRQRYPVTIDNAVMAQAFATER